MPDNVDLARAAGYILSADVIAANRQAARELDEAIARANARPAKRRRKSTLKDPQGEDAMQIELFRWARDPVTLASLPELAYLYHPPMGGGRSDLEGAMMKALGALKGVVDLCLPVARGGYHGVYGELKFGRNGLTKDQAAFLAFVKREGYFTGVWWDDPQPVKTALERYLHGLEVRY